jgi:4-amino-4-deoxy-L-arabinose transferase-like glycosyltransferase
MTDGNRIARRAEAEAVTLTEPWCRWTWLVGGFAILVRVIIVLAQHETLRNDSADYQRLAVSLATGHGFGTSHFAPGGGPTALRPPLFPLFIALVYKIVGIHLLAARLSEAALGGVTVVLLMVITWMLWGRVVALTVGLVAAVFPPLLMASTSLMSESVAVPLEMATILAALLYRRTRRIAWAVGSGAMLGLLVLTRPNMAVLALLLVVLLYRHRPSWRQLGASVALILAGTVVVTPWLVRDRLVMHQWVPVTTQSGYVLAGTYNATSADDLQYPAAWRPANLDPAIATLIARHPHADEVHLDALLQSASDHYIAKHPLYVAKVAYENTPRLFDLAGTRFTQTATFDEYGYDAPWGTLEEVSGLLVLVLAFAGVVLRRGRSVPLAYIMMPLALYVTTVVLQALPRFRAVIDPFLLQLAAVSVVTAVERLRRGSRLNRREHHQNGADSLPKLAEGA